MCLLVRNHLILKKSLLGMLNSPVSQNFHPLLFKFWRCIIFNLVFFLTWIKRGCLCFFSYDYPLVVVWWLTFDRISFFFLSFVHQIVYVYIFLAHLFCSSCLGVDLLNKSFSLFCSINQLFINFCSLLLI
jgi:hypothetical protein